MVAYGAPNGLAMSALVTQLELRLVVVSGLLVLLSGVLREVTGISMTFLGVLTTGVLTGLVIGVPIHDASIVDGVIDGTGVGATYPTAQAVILMSSP